ncbi:MAG: hypothetical protein DMF96_26035, partial [Acidobacteria bacterium]
MFFFVSIILAVSFAARPETVQPPPGQALPVLSPAQPPAPSPRLDPAKGDQNSRYTLGPQDQLKITVFDEPDLSNIYRIDSDGFITFPMINKVAASGITPTELQDRIRGMLASGFIRN